MALKSINIPTRKALCPEDVLTMKTLLLCMSLCFGSILSVSAATITWDSNTEPDIKDVQVYMCQTPSCVVVKSAVNLAGTVPHVPGVPRQSFAIDLTGKEGAIALSARDQSLNESGLSVAVPFDRVAPQVPANLTLQ